MNFTSHQVKSSSPYTFESPGMRLLVWTSFMDGPNYRLCLDKQLCRWYPLYVWSVYCVSRICIPESMYCPIPLINWRPAFCQPPGTCLPTAAQHLAASNKLPAKRLVLSTTNRQDTSNLLLQFFKTFFSPTA